MVVLCCVACVVELIFWQKNNRGKMDKKKDMGDQ